MTRKALGLIVPLAIVAWLGVAKVQAEEPDKDALLRRALDRLDQSDRQVSELRQRVDELTRQLRSRDATQTELGKTQDRLDSLIQAYLVRDQDQSKRPVGREPAADQATIQSGQAAFEQSCTKCHDAARALGKSKDLAGWRATVRRMARKSDANIPTSDWEAIAQYLASRSGTAAPSGADTGAESKRSPGAQFLGGQFDFSLTLAPMWRGGAHEDRLENSGFFPDTWVGMEWHSDKPISARAVACVTCHREPIMSDRLTLAEGVVHFDLDRLWSDDADGTKAAIEAGRFIVPFGGLAGRSNPGAFRTVTQPLIYNMGRNVDRPDIGPVVLPMPYADEGVLFKFAQPVGCDLTATADFYVINGLQGSSDGINFFVSRDYSDNNGEPAVGGRFAIGSQSVQFGGSIMGGQFNDHSGDHELGYELVGADLTLRHEDRARVQFEYALRNSDRMVSLPGNLIDDEEIYGFSVEGELRLCSTPRIGLVARYDTLTHNGDLPPAGSTLTDPDFTVHRFTWGFALTLPGGNLLLINHEHWNMPQGLDDVDVLGLRWVAAF